MARPEGAAAVAAFAELTQRQLYRWQERLLCRWFVEGRIPEAVDIPTGLGKTTAMALWLAALSAGAGLPRRLVYVVDRRTVVDQASEEAARLAAALGETERDNSAINELRRGLRLKSRQPLPVSTLRGQHLDNRRWLEDPAAPAIIIGTVDMIGSRLLFEGYGVSPRMRPVHAGLLGADALIMLDEAHLVPPFAALLRAVAAMPARPPVPRFHLMTLSATGGGERSGYPRLELEAEDWEDAPLRARLDAAKRLRIEAVVREKDLAERLAERAWALGAGGQRVIVYCQRRTVAQEVAKKLADRAKRDGLSEVTELLVGSRRVHEREALRGGAVFRRFLPDAPPQAGSARPVFLVATSAGEVGVDLDADHMVCDLVPWERMVQRLGRVNRRAEPGGHVALIDVFPASAVAEVEPEITDGRLATLLEPFASPAWPAAGDGRRDASPGLLHALKAKPELKSLLDKATSEEPLRPALTAPLLDAWSMTSLAEHPGRPEIEPWLRGWVEAKPQTRVLRRRLLPVRANDEADLRRKILDDFFQNAPPQLGELLETLTEEVVDTVLKRARALQGARQKEAAREGGSPVTLPPVGAVTLSSRGEVEQVLTVAELARLPSRQLYAIFAGRTVVLDAELGGLGAAGLLDAAAAAPPLTLDSENDAWGEDAMVAAGFGVRRSRADSPPHDPDWRIAWRWRLDPEGDSEDGEEIRVEVLRRGGATAGDAAIAKRPQPLAEHHDWAACEAAALADRVGLGEPYRGMLIAAAAVHDAGKARDLWQRAMGAPRGAIYAKTDGRGAIPALLGGYRHEFGSLRDVETDNRIAALPADLRELALHLIASHHGFARPVIAALDPEAPPSACAELARQAALRFARLQAEWGVWGLAWWEALLRAADWAASRALNEGGEKP